MDGVREAADTVRAGAAKWDHHWYSLISSLVSGAASITTGSAPVLPSALAMAKQSVLECPSAVGMDATSDLVAGARKNGPQTADA